MATPETAKAAKPAETVRVKITHENGHRHAGEKYPQGAEIDVSPHDAEIIVDQFKVGERVKGA